MEFTYVWTGNPGSTHDATVLRMSDLFQNSDAKILVGFVILGDSAFPLLQWLITPFRDCGNLTGQQRKFNREHSRSRQVIERSFGLLKCRFRRLLRFKFSNMKILVLVLAACVLHNLCLSDRDFIEVPDEFEACHGMPYARDGHQLQGIQTRQQTMNQLICALSIIAIIGNRQLTVFNYFYIIIHNYHVIADIQNIKHIFKQLYYLF